MDVKVDVGSNLTSLLERLAQQIGTTADKVFPWYVQQAQIEGVTALVALTIIFVPLAIAFLIFMRKAKFDDDTFAASVAALVSGTALLMFLAIGVGDVGTNAARKLMNPNYYAVQMLARDVGRLTSR